MNYTKEQTEYMVNTYSADPTLEIVAKLAIEMEKSTKSVIGKLSREGVYRRNVYKSKSGSAPITKIELVSLIASNLDLDEERYLLDGLEKSPKQVLILSEEETRYEKDRWNS